MKNIKTYIYLSVIGISLLGTVASAQTKTPTERANALTASMDCELGLVPAQLSKVYSINLKAADEMDAAFIGHEDDINLYHKKGAAVDKERDIELREVLDYKQFAKYERISKNNRHLLKKTVNCREDVKTEYDACSF